MKRTYELERQWERDREEDERMEAEFFEERYLNSLPITTDPGDEQPEKKNRPERAQPVDQ